MFPRKNTMNKSPHGYYLGTDEYDRDMSEGEDYMDGKKEDQLIEEMNDVQ